MDSDVRFYCKDATMVTVGNPTLTIFSGSMVFLSLSYRMLVITYCILPLILILHDIVTNVQPLTLIFLCVGEYPESFTNNISVFVAVYIIEVIGIIVMGSTSIGVDGFFGLVVFQMSAIMNVLSNDLNLANANDELFSALRKCIDKHCQFMKYSHRLQTMYGMVVLSIRISNTVLLCAVIYQVHRVCTKKN